MMMPNATPSPALLLFLFTAIFLPSAVSASIRNTVTRGGMSFTFFGAAGFNNETIHLTSSADPGIGMALYFLPVRFLDNTTRSPASFYTHFSFSIEPSPTFGDGMAFVITSNPPPRSLRSCEGCMAVFDDGAHQGCRDDNKTATMAVEFDTRLDTALRDINDNHVGVDVCSIVSVASADAEAAGVHLQSGLPMKTWIVYESETKTLRVWLSYRVYRPLDPMLVTTVDLNHFFHELMYVGFSASNGRGCRAVHKIYKWTFSTTFSSNSTAVSSHAMPPIKGITVSMFSSKEPKALWRNVGLVGGLLFIFLMIAAVAVVCLWKKKKGCSWKRNQVQVRYPVPRISLEEVKVATNGFHSRNILGHDGFATTYVGVLPSGCKVAVKKFDRVEHFTNALSTILSCSPHLNIIQCQGWSWEKDDMMLLVYEFMDNGSLDENLHGAQSLRKTELPWDKRYQIVLQVAAALCFLHEESSYKFFHGDVRSRKIFLDAESNAKLGDLGLARRNQHHCSAPQATLCTGEPLHVAPEYFYGSGVSTENTDIYGFGIVLLEVATGRRPVDGGVVLVDWVWERWGNQQLLEAPDRKLYDIFNRDEMVRMLMVGLSCTHPDCEQRPSMKEIIRMLKGTSPLPLLPIRKPIVRLLRSIPQVSEYSP